MADKRSGVEWVIVKFSTNTELITVDPSHSRICNLLFRCALAVPLRVINELVFQSPRLSTCELPRMKYLDWFDLICQDFSDDLDL